MKKIILGVMVIGIFIAFSSVSYAQNPFIGIFQQNMNNTQNINATSVIGIITSIAGFLMVAGAVLAGIAIVISGIMYMTAGNNQTRVASAKAFFKNGVIGALILFSVGIIVNTVMSLASDWENFFS
jgi:hypothetical protein